MMTFCLITATILLCIAGATIIKLDRHNQKLENKLTASIDEHDEDIDDLLKAESLLKDQAYWIWKQTCQIEEQEEKLEQAEEQQAALMNAHEYLQQELDEYKAEFSKAYTGRPSRFDEMVKYFTTDKSGITQYRISCRDDLVSMMNGTTDPDQEYMKNLHYPDWCSEDFEAFISQIDRYKKTEKLQEQVEELKDQLNYALAQQRKAEDELYDFRHALKLIRTRTETATGSILNDDRYENSRDGVTRYKVYRRDHHTYIQRNDLSAYDRWSFYFKHENSVKIARQFLRAVWGV